MQRPLGYALLVVCALPLILSASPSHAQWPPNIEIVAVDLAGHQKDLAHNQALDMHPSVSRDGRIVFLSTRDGPADLYVMDGHGATCTG